MAAFRKFGVIEIAGEELHWHLRRWGGVSSLYATPRGIAVSVCTEHGRTKELVIEFPFRDYAFGAPKSQAEFESRLRSGIEAAIEAGWRPHSRGKAFVHAVSSA